LKSAFYTPEVSIKKKYKINIS